MFKTDQQLGIHYSRYVLLALLALTYGCAGVHLYNAGEHQLAQKAQSSFSQVNLASKLESQRERIREISTKDREIVRQHVLASRNQALVTLIGSKGPLPVDDNPKNTLPPWDWLKEKLNSRSQQLFSADASEDQQRAIHLAYNELLQQEIGVANAKKAFEQGMRAARLPAISIDCPLNRDALQTIDPAFQDLATDYEQECNKLLALRTKLNTIAPPKSKFRTLRDNITIIKTARAVYLSDLHDKRTAYKAALSAHEKALRESTGDESRSRAENLQALLQSFDQITEGALSLQNLGLGGLALDGKIERLQEQRKFISDVLDAFMQDRAKPVVDPPTDAATPKKVLFALNVLNRELGRALRYPQLSAMVLENERLRIQILGLQQQAANAQTRLTLMERQADAMLAEARWLVRANLDRANIKPDCANTTIQTAISNKIDCRELIVRALLAYANSWSVGRLVQEDIESQLVGLRHEAALVNSEIALAHWNNLIGVPLGQFVALYESGIKPADLARFLNAIGNAAGLTFIGGRIN